LLKKTMVYLGLVDDDYDDYADDYEERGSKAFTPMARVETRNPVREEPEGRSALAQSGRIRPLPRENGSNVIPAVRPQPLPNVVRPSAGDSTPKIVAPTRFPDAKEIADCLKANRPVIVNLQVAERDLQRRMIDFCAGVSYALGGEMEKVAEQVFLLAPSNVKVSDEERQRLQERNFGRY
jgi:cell division inhibitor SepF